MNVLYKKIGIVLLSFTLILLSVIPVFVDALGAPVLNPDAPTGATTQAGPTASGVASAVGTGAGWLAGALFDLQGNFLRIPLFFTMKILAGILGIVGLILDEVMFRTVVNFSEAIKAITAINSVWATIRDLGNMAFIFILLYHGIRMVLGVSSTDIKKVIVGIITAALLVNFSLFVTKAIIDASNIATLGFYNSIAAAGGNSLTVQTTNQQRNQVQEISKFGFSGAFMKPLGITGLFDSSGFEKAFTTSIDQGGKLATVYIGSIIFMLITIFVFLAVSVLFIIRFVAFVILLIMSPLAFLALAIPGLEPMKDKYWNTLWSQALFGPLYMFYSWIILRLMGPGGITGSSTKSLAEALAAPTVDSVSVIINFVILIALLLMSIIEAKKQATKGGFITNNMLSKGQAYMGAAVFGSAGWAGRATLGRYAAKVADDKELQKKADMGDRGARLKLAAAQLGAKSSFDARNTKVFDKVTGNIGDLGAIGSFGKGMPWNNKIGDGGYKGAKANEKKKFEDALDEITKRYKDKNDWAKLADVFNKKEQKEKEYMYKSLSAKERVGLDMALMTTTLASGQSVIQHQSTMDTFKSKLSQEEKEKTEQEIVRYYQKDKKWAELGVYLNSKTSTADQVLLYETLSARDRVAFDAVLANPTLTTTLRDGLAIEEKEKTIKAEKELSKGKKDQDRIDEIHKIATDPVYVTTLTPAQIDSIIKKLPPSQARKLTDESRKNPLIIPRLSVRHLTDLMKDGDLTPDQIREIRANATPTQLTWMNDPSRIADWTP